MNKKFTFLVAALLAGGSFSAMAKTFTLQPTATTIADKVKVYLVAEDGTKGHSADDVAMGVTLSGKTLTEASASAVETKEGFTGTYESGKADVTNFFWTVEKKADKGTDYFTFTNAKTGKPLTFSGSSLVINADDASAAGGVIYFDMTDAANGLLKTEDGQYVKFADGKLTLVDEANKDEATTFAAYTVAENNITADVLNGMLGGDGFSLAPVGTTVADENNVFSQQIKAINFAQVENTETDEIIPAGMYFVVDAPEEIADKESVKWEDFKVDGRDDQDAKEAYIQAFKECTFIAISSYDNYQTTEVGANNQGLKLITIAGADLNIYDQSEKTYKVSGEDIYVGNAAFTVTEKDQYANPGEYLLTVKDASYIKESGKTEQTGISGGNGTTLYIGVTKIAGVNYVTTTTADRATSFKITTSSLVKGISLLNKTQAAAVYTMKFVSGEGEENSEYGKYLAVANGDENDKAAFKLVAQGDDLIDIKLPQYQFAIKDVDTEAQVITFKNIETGVEFKTNLYATDVENQYKLVNTKLYDIDARDDIDAHVWVAEENAKSIKNYGDEKMSAMVVQLDKVTVDAYAGFFKKEIDNNEPYRLVFAQNATTNDKWYVSETKDGKATEISETKSLQVVFEPVTIKDKDEVDVENISTNYVYNKDGKVYRASADLVSYYTYRLRVVDAENAYLQNKAGGNFTITTDINSADIFVVKYNYDGSVSLMSDFDNDDASTKALTLETTTDNEGNVTGITKKATYSWNAYEVPNLSAVRLYLEAEELGVSLPAASGHFTFEAENGGFVNVSDANEGVIAIRTEAGEDLTFWLDTTATEKIIPSFYISKGGKFMYNATDSLNNYAALHKDKANPYELIIDGDSYAKAIFKAGELVNSDTLKTTVDNKEVIVAEMADQNKGILGDINNFQFQIVKPSDAEDNYVVRVANSPDYLANFNGVLGFITNKDNAMRVIVEGQAAPTANEGVTATEVKVVAYDGAINIKNAAGKNVVISTILGQIVANEVLTSDNATISVPAGIAIVSVDGEEAVKVSVR